MRNYQQTSFHSPAKIVETQCVAPAKGEVCIQVAAASVNFSDLLLAKGTYQDTPSLPFTPGLEFSGRVVACGEGVNADLKNMRVTAYAGAGGFAEFACAPAERCLILPDALEYDVAAGLQVAWGTSHIALSQRAKLKEGETLLVLGAGGGVGLSAVTMGKLLGARVVAVARGAEKLKAAQLAGADHLIDSDSMDVRDEMIALGRADVVYDPVGGALFNAAFRSCNPGARILIIGFASGEVPEIAANHALVKNIDLIGINWSAYWAFAPEVVLASGRMLLNWAADGKIDANIHHRFPLAEIEDALDLLRSRKSRGKIIIYPTSEPV
ncbi:NADPH:quinone oxidoreductase family protein [Halocynthiibacter namhaensis]|uniref:NADPH:quinone oxidoreductase family protein n=1 Tax=Halocynthiibacter namhaensis TaxID=1290553 RepID=UPI0005798D00|nr:NADPH:quinone oxidoreductase family protein [Halocynthiibacter namhaensis]